MGEHVKIGNGFMIIYGGRNKIRWVFDSKIGQTPAPATAPANLLLPPQHPAVPFLEGLNTAAQFLQWWEQRRQNQLAMAQHEERRIPWLMDIMNTFYEEFKSGEIREDTLFFFELEITKLFEKIEENSLVDVPSTLLLQISRTTEILVSINKLLNSEHFSKIPNFTLPGTKIPGGFFYRSCYELNEEQVENYLEEIKAADSNGLASALEAGAWAAGVGPGAAVSVARWSYNQYLKFKKKQQDRIESFSALRNLAIELRSSSTMLKISKNIQPTVWQTTKEELEEGKIGNLYLIENGALVKPE